jgi:hypothetical protein
VVGIVFFRSAADRVHRAHDLAAKRAVRDAVAGIQRFDERRRHRAQAAIVAEDEHAIQPYAAGAGAGPQFGLIRE